MTSGAHDGLDGFGPAARRAIDAAVDAAVGLGTTRVGTEHLLLGVLAVPSSGAAEALRDAGVALAAVRRKVAETTAGASAPTAAGAAVERSPRAERALSRSHRFAHDQRAPEARSEHLLLGILDVEGTAGQVLRGLDVDVDALRSRLQRIDLEAPDRDAGAPAPRPTRPVAPPRCPSCAGDLTASGVACTTIGAGAGRAIALSCPACGTTLGVTPA